jgi:hypothetical protein
MKKNKQINNPLANMTKMRRERTKLIKSKMKKGR